VILPAATDAMPCVLEHLTRGELVALPTETVYGLAGDACNHKAVAAIYATKERPTANPLIAHVNGIKMACNYVAVDSLSRRLMEAFWPGPLTFVLPLLSHHTLPSLAHANLPTLGVRHPQGIFADIVAAFGRPLVAPSANRSGRISPTCAQAVADELGDKIPLILDGGVCQVGVESTIVKIVDNDIVLLRPGGIPRAVIEMVAQRPVIPPPSQAKLDAQLESPGQMLSHYAPTATVKLNVTRLDGEEMLLAFGPHRASNHRMAKKIINLSASGSLEEAASRLFDCLRTLDGGEGSIIAVEPIPHEGIGEAINDRLSRAAAPRT